MNYKFETRNPKQFQMIENQKSKRARFRVCHWNYQREAAGTRAIESRFYLCVTPECFNRGSSSELAWIPAKSMRE
jgi:hypothetical protein